MLLAILSQIMGTMLQKKANEIHYTIFRFHLFIFTIFIFYFYYYFFISVLLVSRMFAYK